MPQLDITTISLIYTWTWLTLIMTTRKIQKITLNSGHQMAPTQPPKKPTWTLPWT
uniref:ATP synthase F0 subunit 8 n=1 Tax=Lichanura trivirgata TaxID=51879 RepID=D2W944_LICTR|nr:ATP synthase F0 subunit 8 [Lichanura trivirgata]